MPPDKLADLFRAYGGAVYARCRRILGDGPAAEDAAQETFLRVCRHLEKAPGAPEALRWIYRIATNHCLNELRNRRLRPELTAALDHVPDPQGRLEDLLADRDRARKVIAYVPEKLAVAAWLHHVDGLEQGEVARVLGVSRRTIVYRLAEFEERARKLLG